MDKINKRAIWLILLISFLAFPFLVRAGIGIPIIDYILGTVVKVYETGIVFIFFLQLIILIGGAINGFLALGISLVLSPGIMGGASGWTYTQNPFVNAGLEITGGFISIGLVLALIWIAFATILRLEGYDTKRLLVRLIIVGILVYFSRVICGLIVDASNIFMYYFSDKIFGIGILTNTLVSVGKRLLEILIGIVNPLAWPKIIAESIILISVQFYLATLLIAFFLTFLFRYAAIWIAVVLAPIAFVCSILPATQKYWSYWWREFIGWCLAGPITAFFLYLAARAGQVIASQGLGSQITQFFSGWKDLSPLIPHFFTIGLLQMGLIWGVRSAGWGGQKAYSFAQSAVGWIRGKMEKRGLTPQAAWKRAKGMPLGRTLEPIFGKEKIEKWRRRMEEMAIREATLPSPETRVPGTRGMIIRAAATPLWALRRAWGRAIGFEPTEEARKAEEAGLKEATGLTVQEQVALFRATGDLNRRLGILRAIIQQGNLRDAMNLAQNALQQQEITALYDVATRLGRDREIIGLYPQQAREHWGPTIPGPIPPDMPPQVHQYGYIVGRMRADDFRNIQEDAIARDEHFVEALIRSDNPEKVSEFINRFGVAGAETIQNVLQNLGQRYHQAPRDYLRANNRRLYAYFTRGGGRGLIQI